MPYQPPRAIVGDIGGTKARFAMVAADGTVTRPLVFYNSNFDSFAAALRGFMGRAGLSVAPTSAAFCFAGPMDGQHVDLTNFGWSFVIEDIRRQFGITQLEIINDFAAIALSVPRLADDDCRRIGGGAAVEHAPIAVIGPGTGLGVAGLVWTGERWLPLATEGGHVTMAATDAAEAAVIDRLRARYGHVSAERVISGPGLENLYRALAEIEGKGADALPADQIAARVGEDALCRKAARMFAALLGTAASNLALTLGARGGVYLGGGVIASMGEAFDAAAFRERFEAKGRFQPYLQAIPTFAITRPSPALLGLASLLDAPA